MREDDLQKSVKRFTHTLKMRWQLYFFPSAVLFAGAIAHRLFAHAGMNPVLRPYLLTIDRVSFLIAAILTVVILNLKRRYFSTRFTRRLIFAQLQEDPTITDEGLLKQVFNVWQQKLALVWGLGVLLVLDGIVYYWLTLSLDNNLIIYYVIGSFSMVLNYPRPDWFSEIAWQIAEARRDYSAAMDQDQF
jgi:hypothetical protein